MWKLMLLGLFLPSVLPLKCENRVELQPPCGAEYEIRECVEPAVPSSNLSAQVVQQCFKAPKETVYEKWEFWFALCLVLGLIFGGIITWRCIRYTEWYKKVKESVRHEKNRVCARMCVKYCCRCRCCVKCCEPYTRPTAEEIKASDDGVSVAASHHSHHTNHHHHHLHLDRRRSECVHPAPVDQHPHEPTGYHSKPHKQQNSYENKTLEDVCINSIHIV